VTAIVYDTLEWGDGDIVEWGDGDIVSLTHSIDDNAFLKWLRDGESPVNLLAEIKFGYQLAGLPAESMVPWSIFPYVDEGKSPPLQYAAVIDAAPTLERSLDISKLGGRGTASLGSISGNNADGKLDYLLRYILDGRDVTLAVGDSSWERSQFRQLGLGSVAAIKADDDTKITLTLRDTGLLLDATIIGDPMMTGPNAGKPKPVLFGLCNNFDLTPYLYDATGPSYYFNHYPQDPSLAFGNVILRDQGVSLINAGFSGDNTVITASGNTMSKTAHGLLLNDVLRFSGTDPFAGLVQNQQYWVIATGLTANNWQVSLTRGGSAVSLTGTTFGGTLAVSSRRYYVDATNAAITLSSPPNGQVTADILSQGLAGDAITQATPHSGMRYIMDTWTRLTAANRDTGAFASLVAAEQAAGVQWGRAVLDRTNVLDVFDEIAIATNSWYGWTRSGMLTVGKFDLANLDAVTPAWSITQDDIPDNAQPSYENLPLPFGKIIIDSNRNVVTQASGLATSVSAADKSKWSQAFQTRVKTTDPLGLQYVNDWWNYHKTAIDSQPLETDYMGTGAQALCDERTALFAPYTSVFICTVWLDKYQIEPGSCGSVTYLDDNGNARYGLSNKNFRAASVKMRPADKQIDLVLVRQNVPNWDALGVGLTVPFPSPGIGTVIAGNTKAVVPFVPVLNNGGATITGYTATSSPGGFTATSLTSPLTVTGLTNGTGYTFTVHATNSVGNSAESAVSNSVTPATSVPDVPTAVSAVAGTSTATVTFTAPVDNGGSAIIDSTATSSPGGLTSAAGASPRTVSGLTPGTAYTFTVTARNAIGSSAPSSPSNSVTPGNRQIALTLSATKADGYNIFQQAGSPTDAVDMVLTINAGVDLFGYGNSPLRALETGTGWVAGSTIKLVNHGYILAMGGRGGTGAGRLGDRAPATAGQGGNPAIFMQWNCIIDNTDGFIFGGAGGGGGGGAQLSPDIGGNNGGGGAAYGVCSPSASTGGRLTGGLGETLYGSGVGGNGGDSASPGSAGADNSTKGAPGGAAGPAILRNGYTITWLGGNDGPNGTHVKGVIT
jgi:hypothetical protein